MSTSVSQRHQTHLEESKPRHTDVALPRAKLVERNDITGDLMVVKLEPQGGRFKFKAGQFCTLGLNGIERAYSIVSAPHERFLEIFMELVPEGALTPRLWEMKVGDTVSIRPRAKGLFTRDPHAHHHFMLSTVTGVAPSISFIRDYLHRGEQGHTFYVLLGASYQEEFTYDRELTDLAARYPDAVKFVASVSRPREERNAGWQGATGRVNNIAEEYLDKFNPPKDDTLIYACGHPGMIADAKEKVTAKDWRFKEERFWKG